jgi:hypothetical protein
MAGEDQAHRRRSRLVLLGTALEGSPGVEPGVETAELVFGQPAAPVSGATGAGTHLAGQIDHDLVACPAGVSTPVPGEGDPIGVAAPPPHRLGHELMRPEVDHPPLGRTGRGRPRAVEGELLALSLDREGREAPREEVDVVGPPTVVEEVAGERALGRPQLDAARADQDALLELVPADPVDRHPADPGQDPGRQGPWAGQPVPRRTGPSATTAGEGCEEKGAHQEPRGRAAFPHRFSGVT